MESEIREILMEIRSFLQKHGDVGRWILERIDEALEIGLEVEEEGNEVGVIYRQPKDDMETLEVYINVLEAYMVSLPLCFDEACNYIEKSSNIRSVAVSLESEYAPQFIDHEQKFKYMPEEMFPRQWEKNKQLFESIREIQIKLKR